LLQSYKAYFNHLKNDEECRELYQGYEASFLDKRENSTWNRLVNEVYNEVEDDVDLYVGILMEKYLSGADMGPTAACMQMKQFQLLKDAEYWFYGNPGFWDHENKYDFVQAIDLAAVMCLTLEDTETVPDMPFLAENAASEIYMTRRKMINCREHVQSINFEIAYAQDLSDLVPIGTESPVRTTVTTTSASNLPPAEDDFIYGLLDEV
jgi:hypothetical protein